MKKRITLCLLWILFASSISAKSYQSEHFIIHSDLDSRYIKILQKNVEAFYDSMVGQYFSKGWSKPLDIYYSKDSSVTFKLLCKNGHNEKGNNVQVGTSYYIHKPPSIYTYQFYDWGNLVGLGTLFHEITHHLVRLNFTDAPRWLNEGLACFLGNETRIVKGKVVLGRPHPRRDRRLQEQIEKRIYPNLKKLYSMEGTELYKWPIGYHYSRALLYWIYEEGKLKEYLQNVQRDGYAITVLEQTVHMRRAKINGELLKFIKKHSYAGGYVKQGWRTKDAAQKEQFFRKALELMPNYDVPRLELAKRYRREAKYAACKKILSRILRNPGNQGYRQAAKIIAKCYYLEKNYEEAVGYFQKTLEYSQYYERGYQIYYWLGCSYHFLKDYDSAKKYLKLFLDNNWELGESDDWVEYARDYQSWGTKEK